MIFKYKPGSIGQAVSKKNLYALTGYKEIDLLRFSGLYPSDATINLIFGGYPYVTFDASVGTMISRHFINFQKKAITNLSGEGNFSPSNLFKRFQFQIEMTKLYGFEKIQCSALKDPDHFSEYIIYGTLGFLIDDFYKSDFLDITRSLAKGEQELHELLDYPEGVDVWIEHGFDWAGTFDLNSTISYQVFEKYKAKLIKYSML